jgi:hypothetical protein
MLPELYRYAPDTIAAAREAIANIQSIKVLFLTFRSAGSLDKSFSLRETIISADVDIKRMPKVIADIASKSFNSFYDCRLLVCPNETS